MSLLRRHFSEITILCVCYFALEHPAISAPDDVVQFADPSVAFIVRCQYNYEDLPGYLGDVSEITEAHVARLTRIIPALWAPWDFTLSDLGGLEFATSLEVFDLRATSSESQLDLTPLVGLPVLKELELGDTTITDLAVINQLTGLETLELISCGLDTVPDISALSNLDELDLSNNPITDLSELSNHPGLTRLKLSGCLTGNNLAALVSQPNLEWLTLGNNGVTDLTDLAALTKLTHLYLWSNDIQDLSPIAGLSDLRVLSLHSNPNLSDLAPVSGMQKLQWLLASGCQISNLSPVTALTALEELNLRDNSITDLAPIAQLPKLETIDFTENQLTSLPDLSALTALEVAHISSNFLDPLPGGPSQVEISALRARGVNVDDRFQIDPYGLVISSPLRQAIRDQLNRPVGWISPADMAGITSLSAPQGGLYSLVGIEHAVNLEQLDLSQNSISDLTPLAGLSALTDLDLASNQIVDLAPLAGLTALTDLNLASNRIADLSPLAGLGNLLRLDLANNGVIDIAPLAGLSGLDYLDLDVNGLDDTPGSASGDIIAQLEAGGTSVDVNGQQFPVTVFADPELRSRVLSALGIEESRLLLSSSELAPMRRLALRRADITDLSGIEDATNLEALQLSDNLLTDLALLSALTKLAMLDISGNPEFVDLAPLAALPELQYLDISGQPTSELGALSGLTKLEQLLLGEVTDPAARMVVSNLQAAGTQVFEAVLIDDPQPGELAITKFHYRPPSPDGDELGAGFERSDFEYIVIKNLSASTVVLAPLQLEGGVLFRFHGDVIYRSVPPGFEFAVARNLDAFTMRYGSAIRYRVIGEYDGELADGSGQIKLVHAGNGSTYRNIRYNVPGEPWPEDIRGELPMIMINQDPGRIDDDLPQHWRVPRTELGVFESDVYTYEQFIAEHFAEVEVEDLESLKPNADFDRDGSSNVEEYAFATDPLDPMDNETLRVDSNYHEDPETGARFIEIGHFRQLGADEAVITAESSADLENWTHAPAIIRLEMSPLPTTDLYENGPGYWRYRATRPIGADRNEFLRFSVRLLE